MKRFRGVVLGLLAIALLAGIAWWSQRQAREQGRELIARTLEERMVAEKLKAAQAARCVEAYRDACAAGDVAKARACLGDPLRAERERSLNAEGLKRELAGVVSWAQHDAEVSGATALVDVDRGRRDGVQRVRFRLEQSRTGWLIVGIESPQRLPTIVPYGTHVSKVP